MKDEKIYLYVEKYNKNTGMLLVDFLRESDFEAFSDRFQLRFDDNYEKYQSSYRNYNNKKIFEFKRPNNEPITIQERVWKHIGDNFENLHFIVILDSDDEDERLIKEMNFAEKEEAVYWNYSPKQRKLKAKSLAEQ